MKVSIVVEVSESLYRMATRGLTNPAITQVELSYGENGSGQHYGVSRHRDFEFIATVGDSISETIALRVVQELKRLNGEPALDPASLDLRNASTPGNP